MWSVYLWQSTVSTSMCVRYGKYSAGLVTAKCLVIPLQKEIAVIDY